MKQQLAVVDQGNIERSLVVDNNKPPNVSALVAEVVAACGKMDECMVEISSATNSDGTSSTRLFFRANKRR